MKKLCIIGCGGIGMYHLNHILGFSDIVEPCGFCDLIYEKAEGFVTRAGHGKAFSNYSEMYDEIKPDMVFICVPPYCHGDIEFETIRRGIPFFVEKPLALDIQLARRIRDASEKKNLITASGFQCRYSNLVTPHIDFCRDNKIVLVNCTRIGDVPDLFWWKDKSLSGGQVVEQSIHQFDIIRYTVGEPDEVFSYSTRGFVSGVSGYNTDDCSVTTVKFKNGALGTFSVGCYANAADSFDSKIIFSAKDSRAELKILEKFEIFKAESKQNGSEGLVVQGDGTFRNVRTDGVVYTEEGDAGILCDRTFVEAVISGDGSKIRSPYRDAMKSVAFTLAVNHSIQTGKPVKVELE